MHPSTQFASVTDHARLLVLVVSSLAAACGDASDSGPGDTTGDSGEAAEVAGYQELIGNVQVAADGYRVTMTSTTADCREVHDDYDALVRPWLAQLVETADGMDAHMTGHGHHAVADMGCVMASLMYELDDHHARACASPDPAANADEAERHVDRMLMGCAHAWDRCDELMRGLEQGVWDHDAAMQGCEDWDGCCSSLMHGCCHEMMGMHPACCGD